MEARSIEEQSKAMSEAYWKLWNPEEQARIDRDIETNRKADGVFRVAGIPEGADVKVEQTSHAFIFGAHIFNFDQLGSDECNAKYKELYGTLFNSATIAFYWRCFEPEEGKPRFAAKFEDTAEYWNKVAEPKKEPHWRRPATDPVVEFCKSKGIRLHGHPLTWGNYRWQFPNETVIEAHGYLLVWADAEIRMGGLNSNFKLDASGGVIGLFASDGSLIDSVTYGEQIQDISYGRTVDGGSSWSFMTKPTPGEANSVDTALFTGYPWEFWGVLALAIVVVGLVAFRAKIRLGRKK